MLNASYLIQNLVPGIEVMQVNRLSGLCAGALKNVRILIPRNCESYLIWKQGLPQM